MSKFAFLMLLGVVGLASWLVFSRYEFRVDGWEDLGFVAVDKTVVPADPAKENREDTIRIASFNIQTFGPSKVGKPEVMELLVRIIRQYDIVAIQEVRSKNQDVLQKLKDALNATGRQYELVNGPRVGRTKSKEQYIYVFDRTTIEVDRSASYTVEDPDDLLHRPPFVAWFRVRGPPPDEAFTFKLVNVHTDPDEVSYEMEALDNVFFGVRRDGRGEDDVIMLGDFNADDSQFGPLGQTAGITAAISGKKTNTRRTRQYDNVIFQLPASSEYTGRSGVFDFMRKYNLSLEQALVVTDHLPVWAEFSKRESGSMPSIASGSPTAAGFQR